MSKLLEIKDLVIKLKKENDPIVEIEGFFLEKGRSLIILGKSGCGKTMTCHSIMGLLDPRTFRVSGEILYQGIDLLTLSAKERRKFYGGEIALIPQNPMTAFDPSVKLGKQLMETLSIHTNEPKDRRKAVILAALQKAGLEDEERVYHSFPHELSGGMLQRVLIAMVLMVDAKIVIADEPTTALDVVHRNETINAFRRLRDSGTAILAVTHDFAAAIQLGGDVLIMNDGRIVEVGRAEEILSSPRQSYTRQLIDASILSTNVTEVVE